MTGWLELLVTCGGSEGEVIRLLLGSDANFEQAVPIIVVFVLTMYSVVHPGLYFTYSLGPSMNASILRYGLL